MISILYKQCIITIFTPWEFFTLALAEGFHWNLSDKKSPQISRTVFIVLAGFSNAVIWMVFTHSRISKSTSPFTNPLVIVTKPLFTLGYYNNYTPCAFLTSVLTDGLSLESERQQVSLGLQDFSQYSGWSQQCCSLDGFFVSSDFQLFQFSFWNFVTVSIRSITIGIIVILMFHRFLSLIFTL